ncbi:MAG: insulinase family protein [Bacteroidales bacterium]|nr:insulinase family protein [Bacteroidales bacterium]
MECFTRTLRNGIRIVHAQITAPVAHIGFFIQTGSRDETDREAGMAHFAEHIFFKHTHKRNTYQIISRMEDVGGDLNAYTTKEETCLHASFMLMHYERAIELIADLVFNRNFRAQDVEKEKEVVIDEINSSRDVPSENIFDDFDAQLFGTHPLAHPILGRAADIRRLTAEQMEQFVSGHYFTDRMVIASVGAVSFERLVKWCEKYFGHIPEHLTDSLLRPSFAYVPEHREIRKRIHQAHCCIGAPGYDCYHPRRLVLALLCNLFGGPGMNTRLNLALREHQGLSYTAEAAYTPYTDTGVTSIYFSAEKNNLDQCIDIVRKELEKICTVRLGTMQLHRARHQLIGQMAISADSHENLMLTIGKNYMVYNKVTPLAETCLRIGRITASELLETANEIWAPERLTMLVYR